MVDTVRTLSYLLGTLFPDGQAAGSITAQDIRDLIVSVRAPQGKQYFTGNTTATTITTAGVHVKAAGTTIGTLATPFNVDTTTTPNRLIYTGAEDRHFHFVSQCSLFTSGANQEATVQLHFNGAAMLDTASHTLIKSSGDIASLVSHGDLVMSTNDYVELFVSNQTSTNNITVEDMYLFGMGMLV